MSDTALRDQAVTALAAELVALKTTTRGLKGYTPTSGSQWAKALAARQQAVGLLAQIGQVPPPPPSPPANGVDAVIPPSSYTAPQGQVVKTTAQLLTALQANVPVVVLAPGSYDNPTPFQSYDTSIYASALGAATLTAGLGVNPRSRVIPTLQGFVIGCTDPAKAPSAGGEARALSVWDGNSAGVRLLDLVIDGGKARALAHGVWGGLAPNLTMQRVQVRSFSDTGARLMDAGSGTAYSYALITDLDVDTVSRTVPGSSNGQAEAGAWIGEPVIGGVHRVKIRNVSWSGIETVHDVADTVFSDLDIDMRGPLEAVSVAVYMEHYTRRCIFEDFLIYAATGFNGEWNYGTPGDEGADHDTIRNGAIDAAGGKTRTSRTVGVNLDEGTDGTVVDGVTFRNQAWAAVGAFKNATPPIRTNCKYQLAAGAVEYSTDHV